jgi:hypothetical protein
VHRKASQKPELPEINANGSAASAYCCLWPISSLSLHTVLSPPRDPPRLIRDPACYSTSVMRRTWTWTFDLPPDDLWPVLADTNRFNEAMGLPTYVLEETPQANGTILRRGRGKAAGFTLEWEEKPYEWIHGRHFRQARVFTKGPFRRFGTVFDLDPDGSGGSKVSYALDWEPLTLMGRLFGARLARQAGETVGGDPSSSFPVAVLTERSSIRAGVNRRETSPGAPFALTRILCVFYGSHGQLETAYQLGRHR